ncbi:MAG: MarR family transcriptional regulator [Rhodobacteraceae bacterium]|nr:MarR family transcriptional regulator [Paracoccaceae bacterium]
MSEIKRTGRDTGLPDFDIGQFLPYRMTLAAQILSETLSRAYRDRFGLSIPEWRVLAHLATVDGASVRDIESRVAMEKSKVSRAASRLEARGLLSKQGNPEDRRLVHLTLTAEGIALMRDLLPLAEAFQRRIEDHLGAEFQAFDAQVQAIIDGFGAKGP